MQKERATREERAQKQCTCTTQRVTQACDFSAFLQALGACGAQKLRRISSKLARFQAKIVKFLRRFRCKKHCRAQQNLRDLFSMHAMIVRAFDPRSACVCGCDRADFQKFQRQNRAVFDRKTAQLWCKGQLKDRGVLGAANLQTKFKNIFEII